MATVHLGIVTPVYNEQDCLPRFRARVQAVLDRLDCRYDVYLVDDGSTDDTPNILQRFASEDPRWHGIFLSRNFGHQAAISAGLKLVRGDAVIVMDGDLQDEPEAIPELLRHWQDGYDTVYAVRTKRKEGVLLRGAYWLYYRLLSKMSGSRVPLDAGDFCLMSRRVVDTVNALPESSRFVRGLRAWVGFKQIGVKVERQSRAAGEPKYTFRKLLQLAFDGMLDFSQVPLRAVAVAGLLSLLGSGAYLVLIVALHLAGRVQITSGMLALFLVALFGGAILGAVGIVGEYLGRTFAEVKGRPTYLIAGTTDSPIESSGDDRLRQSLAAVTDICRRPIDVPVIDADEPVAAAP